MKRLTKLIREEAKMAKKFFLSPPKKKDISDYDNFISEKIPTGAMKIYRPKRKKVFGEA